MRTTYKAISTEKGNIPVLYGRTMEELQEKINRTCFSYKIEEVKRESNWDKFVEYAEKNSIKVNAKNFRNWFEAQS